MTNAAATIKPIKGRTKAQALQISVCESRCSLTHGSGQVDHTSVRIRLEVDKDLNQANSERQSDIAASRDASTYPLGSLFSVPKGVIPTVEIRKDSAAPSGKQNKKDKQFRIPGERNVHVHGRMAIIHDHEQYSGANDIDSTATIANALLSAGILQESDWRGSLERTIRQGLTRWTEEQGLDNLKIFRNLSLVYTDDSLHYSSGCRMSQWIEEFQARSDRPVGFFGFRQDAIKPKPIYIKDRILELEALWPGYGYMFPCLMYMTSISSMEVFHIWQAAAMVYGMYDHRDEFNVREILAGRRPASGSVLDEAAFTLAHFKDNVPEQLYKTQFRLERLLGVNDQAVASNSPHARFTQRAVDLWDAARTGGLNFHITNHQPLMQWEMTVSRPEMRTLPNGERVATMLGKTHKIPKLIRPPSVVTIWDDHDPIQQLCDDYIEYAWSEQVYSDLTWMHAFQIGFSGKESKSGSKTIDQRSKQVQKAMKKQPEILAWSDPDYVRKPMPDGSLDHAVKALKIAVNTLKCYDDVLFYLSGGEL